MIPHFVMDVCQIPQTRITFREWINADPIRPLHQTHARYALYGAVPPGADDPGIVGSLGGVERLLDGYHRAVRFWYRRDLDAGFRIYRAVPPNSATAQ